MTNLTRSMLFRGAALLLAGTTVLSIPSKPQAGIGTRFAVDVGARRFSFGPADESGASIKGARLGLEVDGRTLWADQASRVRWDGPDSGEISGSRASRLELSFDSPAIAWTIDFCLEGAGNAGLVASTIRNSGSATVRLGRCRLAELSDEGSEVRLGAGMDRTVALLMSGWQGPSQVKTIRSGGRKHVSKTLVELYNPAPRAALHLGFLTFDRVNTEHEVRWDETKKILGISSYCDFEGFPLPAGKSVVSETLVLQTGPDPYRDLQTWAELVQAQYQPRIWPKIPAGWVGWSWVDPFHSERYEEVVHRNARAVRERLPGLDIGYIWVSIGNLAKREPGNWLGWNYELFPAGPQALVRDLAGLDFRLGFWAGAFWLSSQLSEDVARLKEALLLRDGKPLTVPHRELGAVYVLDPTHPATQERLRRVFTTYRNWGVRYFMIDFLDAVSGSTPGTHRPDSYFDRTLIPGPQAYRAGLAAIRDAAGPDTYLLASTGPTLQNIGLVDGCRVGTDYGEGRPLDGPGKGFYPATFVINRPEYWTSHRRATDALATHFFMHRKLFIADSGNVLTLDKPAPLNDAQISATIFGINGGPLMLGDDIGRMAEERLAMVKQLFPRPPECAVPLDLFDSPDPNYPRLFHLKVRREWEQWDLIAVFNYGNEVIRHRVAFERLALDPSSPRVAWDFWNERYLGVLNREMEVVVPPQSVRLLRISPQRAHPWLLSTDMHIRQGQTEVEECRWDASLMRLTLRAARPAGYRGNVFVLAPKGLALKDPAGLWIAKDGNDGSLVIRCPFEFASGPAVTRTLTFMEVPSQ